MRLERSWNNEAEVWPDHIHILVSILPKLSVSGYMRCLGGKIVYWYIKSTQIWNLNIGIENFGVEGIMNTFRAIKKANIIIYWKLVLII